MQLKDVTNRWLTRNAKTKGIIACGVRHADLSTFNHTSSQDFSSPALDASWECVAQTFQFLKQHKNELDQMCWAFQNHLLYCAWRADDTCLGIVTSSNHEEHDPATINRLIAEFKAIKK